MQTAIRSFRHTIRVRWVDTDESGCVHFANYVRYMEETEYAFLRSINLSIVQQDEKGFIGFPRRSTEFEVENPARFDDLLEVELELVKCDGIQLEYHFKIRCEATPVACGTFKILCCRFISGKSPYAILIPEDIMEKFEGFQAGDHIQT